MEQLEEIKGKTDQLIFVNGKVESNAGIDMSSEDIDIARESSLKNLIAVLASRIHKDKENSLTAMRGSDWRIDIPCDLPRQATLQFAIKNPPNAKDSQSMVFIDTTTGLLYLNGQEAAPNDAYMTYDGYTLVVVIKAKATAKILGTTYRWGIQSVIPTGSGKKVIMANSSSWTM